MSDRGCKIEGCERKHFGRGFCNAHYLRLRRYGDALAGQAPRLRLYVRCTIADCDKPHFGHGLCSAHYTRRYRQQDLHVVSARQRVKELPVNEIIRLYTVESYSTTQLAERFGVADVTLSKLLKKHGVSVRGIRAPRIHFRGSKKCNWKADRSQLRLTKSQSRPAFETTTWRKAVMARDRFECRSCGAHKNLQAHHIESWSTCPEKRFDVSNGVTFCVPCHVDFHKRFGRRNNNRVQLAEFLASALMEIAA